jgi:Mce-associated membrane protein
MTPSWYDVLGVEPDASDADVRAAWKAGVADLDPTDRRFRLLNRAAEVLLDGDRRAAHDAELAAQAAAEPDDTDESDGFDGAAGEAEAELLAERPATTSGSTSTAPGRTGRTSTGGPGRGVLVALGAAAAALLVAVVVSLVAGGASDTGAAAEDDGSLTVRDVAAARAAAEAAVVPVLSYDYRTLERDKQAAISYMTPGYAEEYEQLFEAVVAVNAPATETVVSVDVQASGVVRTGEDLVDVLLFVDRPTVNREQTTPEIYKDQATVRMRQVGGEWLVDCLITGAGADCER